jgi:hypothetical protein
MLSYYKGGYNDYMIRTAQLPSGSKFLLLSYQDMITLENSSVLFDPNQWTYNACESFVSFSVNFDINTDYPVGTEFRLTLTPAVSTSAIPFTYRDDVWNGSIQFYASQSINKPVYKTQNDEFISYASDNEFIIVEPFTGPTTTTTTLPPPTTTTTSTTTAAPQIVRVYLASSGSVPADVHLWYRTGTPTFQDLGVKTPGVYPSYNLVQNLQIPPTENIRFGTTNLAAADITFGTGSNSGQFTTNCGLVNPTLIPELSWSGSIDVYINVATQGGNYVLCP